jgi:hypothetical protein
VVAHRGHVDMNNAIIAIRRIDTSPPSLSV